MPALIRVYPRKSVVRSASALIFLGWVMLNQLPNGSRNRKNFVISGLYLSRFGGFHLIFLRGHT